jgi:hypothetical protein
VICQITNVVFIATDDHQNRINELTYSPTGNTENQFTYVKVPYAFSIVAGPLGATGPDLITNHTFAMAQQYANSIVAAQQAAGVEPIGLIGYPGLHDLARDGDPTAGTAPQPVDFYSPDTFNFTVLDVAADGKKLTVKSIGMDSTAQNAGIEYANGPQARTIFTFQVDAAPALTSVITGLQFDRQSVSAGSSYSANVSGSDVLTSQTFFDVRFIGPGSNASSVVLNWQKGLTLSHAVPAGTAAGTWTITGVRAHQAESDHTGDFVPVYSTITVVP